ncbi:MAG: phosphoglycerate kinase [Candidatus Methanospirare jalkutatii]|nr:phosphoglycerate kinase [Candidatus Methanospirare jalkutatii]
MNYVRYAVEDFLRLEDFAVAGKTVLLRVDINSRVDDGKLRMTEKIEKHAKTMRELSERGAKTVVLSHQGRVGDARFMPLEQHAALLNEFVRVNYVDDIIGPAAREAIRGMWDGEVLLLDNVRLLAEETLNRSAEEHARSIFVRKLAPLCDLYINDAFETSHRSHASLVGFPYVLPAGIGLVTEEELRSLARLAEFEREGFVVYVLGGSKLGDVLPFIKRLIASKSCIILTAGRVANAFLAAKEGIHCGVEPEYVEFAAEILQMSGAEKIKIPKDVAIERGNEREEIAVSELKAEIQGEQGKQEEEGAASAVSSASSSSSPSSVSSPSPSSPLSSSSPTSKEFRIYDIGAETCDEYISLLSAADAILVKGPAGIYEKEGFAEGTARIFNAVARSNAFTVLGGGDTTSALNAVGISENEFSYVSLAGGALLKFLLGEELPALEVLKSKRKS